MSPAEQAALGAALKLSYPAFPCIKSDNPSEDKAPACPRGFHAACRGAELERLWSRYPGGRIGVPTGPASGLAVLDVDPGKGGDEWWNANRSRLPATRMHRTRSGGIHVLFKHRDGLRCSASKIAPGIDVRAEGGYIVWHPFHNLPVRDFQLADWPDWLRPPAPEPVRFTPLPAGPVNSSRYGSSALDRACAAISVAANGAQEATLNREAFSIGQLAAVGIVDRAGALNRVTAAALSMPSYDSRRPWTRRELIDKVNRAFGQGLQRPRNPVRRVG
jgi:Bifunctional DNA primase/polymerase, N-terminal